MNIIFAKHDGCGKEFAFRVPFGMRPEKDDVLWVDTCKGKTIAIATTGVVNIGGSRSGAVQIINRVGAYQPLKMVIAYANKEMQTYCENRAFCKVGTFCRNHTKNICEDDLPF